jgi:putative DNA primase/helicase
MSKNPDINDFAKQHGLDATRARIDDGCDLYSGGAPADDDAEIKRLAGLSSLEYERQRKAAAERLALRANILDTLVKAEREKAGKGDGKQGRRLTFPSFEPWPEAVDGTQLLTELSAAIGSYVVVSNHQADALALWSVFTHAFDAFDIAPKVILKSPEKRCGKTRLAKVLAHLVTKPLFISGIRPAALLRVIELYQPTVLLDEIDTAMKQSQEMAEALRGLINSGFDRAGAKHVLTVGTSDGGFEPREFSTWAPQMLAGIGELPDTVRDRSVEIEMRRKRPDEKVRRLRQRDGADLDILCRKVARWTADKSEVLRDVRPEMPAGLDDRAADAWEPLIAIADTAGGDWPERSRNSAIKLSGDVKQDDSERVTLLADINQTFTQRNTTQLATADLIESLTAFEGHPWAEWKGGKPITPTGLARLLAPFHIYPTTIRLGDKTAKGYRLLDFSDAFGRYLPCPPTIQPSQRNKADGTGTSRISQAVTPDQHVTASKSQKPLQHSDCYVVTPSNQGVGGVAHSTPPIKEKRAPGRHDDAPRAPVPSPPSTWETEL